MPEVLLPGLSLPSSRFDLDIFLDRTSDIYHDFDTFQICFDAADLIHSSTRAPNKNLVQLLGGG